MTEAEKRKAWVIEQLKLADESLPQCGQVGCMEGAVISLSYILLNHVDQQVDLTNATPEFAGTMIQLARAHEKLAYMHSLDSKVSNEVAH